jgi:Zn finger protein HypA/HybF involved in hydrogenase expression
MDEHDFVLPLGFVDEAGVLHRSGTMRLATAADEILPMADPRVQALPAYKIIILLSRVVVRLGSLEHVNPSVIEGLFVKDLAYLEELYGRINGRGARRVRVTCPKCSATFETEVRAGRSKRLRREK